MIYVSVHSHKFYQNNPEDPNNNDYFKHYFTIEDLDALFKKESFERIYVAEIEKKDSRDELRLVSQWFDKSCKQEEGIKDQKVIDVLKAQYMKNKMQSDIVAIFRRR